MLRVLLPALLIPLGMAFSQPIRSPVSVLDPSLGSFNDDTKPEKMIDQSSLSVPFTSGVTGFDAYFGGGTTFHQAGGTGSWQSQYVDPPPVVGALDFDLGATYTVSKVAIWNARVKDVEILFADAPGGPFQSAGTFTLFDHNSFVSFPADLLTLTSPTNGRYMRIQITSAYQISPALTGTYATIGEVAVRAAEASGPPPPPGSASIVNMSVRSPAGTGDATLIVGFAVGGTGSKAALLRGAGPALTGLGVVGALADPTLRLYADGVALPLQENDDWGGGATLANLFTALGAFDFAGASLDSAMTATVPNGSYTAHVTSDSGTGIALAEVYDTDSLTSVRLVNISARTQVGTGQNILIAGFVIGGTGSMEVLIRGIGPGLTQFGVTGVLANPQLQLFADGTAAPIAQNNNWGGVTTVTTAMVQTGAFDIPTNSTDAALVAILQPGSYTAQVSGVAGGTGIGLVEVYEIPNP